MKKIMFWSDSPTLPTGFANVVKSIIKHIPRDKYKISVIGNFYKGETHNFNYYIHSVVDFTNDDYVRLLKKEDPDIFVIINDSYIVNEILGLLKSNNLNKKKNIITYIPADCLDHDPDWYTNFDIASTVVAYNEFGKQVINKANPNINPIVIEHGVDSKLFYKTEHSKKELRQILFGDAVELDDKFIFLNANRNQYRKSIDISMRAFAEFSKDKDDVMLYMHCGYIDAHIDVLRLAKILNIEDKLIMTSTKTGMQDVEVEHLNLIYNFCDVGLNSSIGEGFGLCNAEHAAIGKPQIVGDHSALKYLHSDCGITVPVTLDISMSGTTMTGKLISYLDMADAMQKLYRDRELYDKLSIASSNKFNSTAYSWKYIVDQWLKLF